jgi:ribosome-associated toxin RatA of RatAB toxin-antitoxin module
MRSSLSVEMSAPPELVFQLARDVTRWPALLPHYAGVEVEDRHDDGAITARMVAVRPLIAFIGLGIPVAWRSRTWAEPQTHQLRFLHRGGATDGMDVTWRIEPSARGCRVSIVHDFHPRSRLWGLLVTRLFVRPIAGRTLATFTAIAEAVAATEARSEMAADANPQS